MTIFLDACTLIYLIEGNPAFAARVKTKLAQLMQAAPNPDIAISRLSWLECRVAPIKRQQNTTLARYDAIFSQPDLAWIELDRHVVELATAIRARTGLRTPDSLQAASCLQLGKEHIFLTGDKAFNRVHGLNCEIVAAT